MSALTHYTNTTELPIPLPGVGQVRLMPRHLDAETVERAQEWQQYHDQPEVQAAMASGGPTGAAVEAKDHELWDDFVDATAATMSSREQVVQLIAALAKAADQAWPEASGHAPVPARLWRPARRHRRAVTVRHEPEGDPVEVVALVGRSRQWDTVMQVARTTAALNASRVFVRLRPATNLPRIMMADVHLTTRPGPARL